MKLQLVLSVFVMLGSFVCLVNCPDAAFAGVNYPYPDQRCPTQCVQSVRGVGEGVASLLCIIISQ